MSFPVRYDFRVQTIIHEAGEIYEPPDLSNQFVALLRNIPLTELPGLEASFFLYDPTRAAGDPLPAYIILYNGRPLVFGDPAAGPVPYIIFPPQ